MPFARFRFLCALVVLGLLLASAPAMAQGTAGAYSLQIPPGARAEGMGRSFTAIADDAFAPWWNPGGLAFLDGQNASLMHTKLVPDLADDVYFEYISYAQHLAGWGGIAGTITYLSYGESQATDGSSGDLGTFSSWEIAPSVAIGTSITDNLGLGANLKYVHLDLAPALSSTSGQAGKGSTFAVDIGALYRIPNAPINLALVVQNLGPDIALVDEEQADPLPRMLRVGGAWQVVNKNAHSLIFAFDADKLLLSDEGGAPPDTLFEPTWFDE
ncbi:MAG TPA: PorV/PorQ family protein, partial [Candidatus Eisenbacteria bacterium]